MGFGSFFTGLSQGLAEEQQRKNLLELQQDLENRKAYAQHFMDIYKDPRYAPEAQQEAHRKAMDIIAYPVTKKLKPEHTDLSKILTVKRATDEPVSTQAAELPPVPAPPPPLMKGAPNWVEDWDIPESLEPQKLPDVPGISLGEGYEGRVPQYGERPGMYSPDEQAQMGAHAAALKAYETQKATQQFELELAEAKRASGRTFATTGRPGTATGAQLKEHLAGGAPYDPVSVRMIAQADDNDTFGYEELPDGTFRIRPVSPGTAGLVPMIGPGGVVIPGTRVKATGELIPAQLPGGGVTGVQFPSLTGHVTGQARTTATDALGQTSTVSQTGYNQPVIGGPAAGQGPAATAPPPTVPVPYSLSAGAGIPERPVAGRTVKEATQDLPPQTRFMDMHQAIRNTPDPISVIAQNLPVDVVKAALPGEVPLADALQMRPSDMFTPNLNRIKDPRLREGVAQWLDNPTAQLSEAVKTQLTDECFKAKIPIPGKASSQAMNQFAYAMVSRQAIRNIENLVLGQAYDMFVKRLGPLGGRWENVSEWWGRGYYDEPVDESFMQDLRTKLQYFSIIEAKVLMGGRPAWMWVQAFQKATARGEMTIGRLAGALKAALSHADIGVNSAAYQTWGARYNEVLPNENAPWLPGSPREGDMRIMPGGQAAIARFMADDEDKGAMKLYWVQEFPSGNKMPDGTPIMRQRPFSSIPIWPPKGVSVPVGRSKS